jgi:hypothetical protein
MDWQDISTFPGNTPFVMLSAGGREFKSYAEVLVFGPTWQGGWHDDYPNEKPLWTGKPDIFLASTYEGKGHFTASPWVQDHETHIQPTHWCPVEPPQQDTDR